MILMLMVTPHAHVLMVPVVSFVINTLVTTLIVKMAVHVFSFLILSIDVTVPKDFPAKTVKSPLVLPIHACMTVYVLLMAAVSRVTVSVGSMAILVKLQCALTNRANLENSAPNALSTTMVRFPIASAPRFVQDHTFECSTIKTAALCYSLYFLYVLLK